jgi:hypothetical protein
MLRRSEPVTAPHHHDDHHGHSHGLVDPSIVRSRAGIRAVSWSLAILTAIPLAVVFFLRSARGQRWAGLAVVLAIFVSALVALGQTIERSINPRTLSHSLRQCPAMTPERPSANGGWMPAERRLDRPREG